MSVLSIICYLCTLIGLCSIWFSKKLESKILIKSILFTIGIIGLIITIIDNTNLEKFIQKRLPSITLEYEKQSEIIEKNLYKTVFMIKINQPPGNQEPGLPQPSYNIKNAQCSELDWRGTITKQEGGIFSTQATFEVICYSENPIKDNKRLFTLKK